MARTTGELQSPATAVAAVITALVVLVAAVQVSRAGSSAHTAPRERLPV